MTGTANPPEIEQAQTATLRRIGRNLVNVQRIEVMMKFLLQVSFSGPLQGIETQLKKHMDKVSRKTLGALIPELAESVFPPGEAMSSERLWIRTSIDFGLSAETEAGWKEEWEKLRVERNRLVHLMLAHVDLTSPEQCRLLDVELDAQNILFLKGVDFLGPIVTATKKSIATLNAEFSA